MSDVTRDGERLIRGWLDAKDRLERTRAAFNSADVDLRNAETELSRWLLPDDAQKGEVIAVWHGDSLVQATANENIAGKWSGQVKLRLQGKHWGER